MIKKLFDGRGKIINFVLCALTLVILIIYIATYTAKTGLTEYSKVSGYALGFLLASVAAGAGCMLLGVRIKVLNAVLPYIQFALSTAAFMSYIYAVYYYVSVVLVGLDLDSFSFGFILCSAAFAVLQITAFVNVFIPHDKAVGKCGKAIKEGGRKK